MNKWFYRILLFVFFALLASLTVTDSLHSTTYVNVYELIKPVNQRLGNELSDFEGAAYIDLQVSRFMDRAELKGVSLAIVNEGKLVFSRGYGFANEEEGIETSPEHIYRLASVSKLITAVAIMKLVEEDKLSLDDKVFGSEGFFNDEAYLNIRDSRLYDITILHLLQHTAGWTQQYGDPAFNQRVIATRMGDTLPIGIDTYLRFAVSRNLHFSPGSRYSYSNMAYMFLGAIIEQITGLSYEKYVQHYILFPNDIYDMHLANNSYTEKFENEVRYYPHDGSKYVMSVMGDSAWVSKPYGGNDIRLLGAAGGWVSSATELSKLLTLIDGCELVPDLLTAKSIEQMTSASDRALGWSETVGNTWTRTGSFSGTAAMMQRRSDGVLWVFLTNTSNWKGPGFSKDINQLMGRIIRRTEDKWPEHDLFNYFSPDIISYKPDLFDTYSIH